MDARNSHDDRILDQFTKQANPFADKPEHSHRSAVQPIIERAEVAASHTVLDVACGPGLLATALARVAKSVVGTDIVPAMLERAAIERDRAGLTNLRFDLSDARTLPYEDASFDRVLTRFSFHHFEQPGAVLAEMVRVCKPGGLVAVIDVVPEPEKLAAYDEAERLRDPSHAGASTLAQVEALFAEAGLAARSIDLFQVPMALEAQLAASFPLPGDADRLRALFRRDVESGMDRLSMHAHERDGALHFSYPCAIVVGEKH